MFLELQTVANLVDKCHVLITKGKICIVTGCANNIIFPRCATCMSILSDVAKTSTIKTTVKARTFYTEPKANAVSPEDKVKALKHTAIAAGN